MAKTASELRLFRLGKDAQAQYPNRLYVSWQVVLNITNLSDQATFVSGTPILKLDDELIGLGLNAVVRGVVSSTIDLSVIATATNTTLTATVTREILQANGSVPSIQNLSEQDRLLIAGDRVIELGYRAIIVQDATLEPLIRTDLQYSIKFPLRSDRAKMRVLRPIEQDARATVWKIYLEEK